MGVINDRSYRRSSSVVNSEESDLQRKKSSSVVSSYKLHEMYTNRAYETSSDIDNMSANSSANSGLRGTSMEKEFSNVAKNTTKPSANYITTDVSSSNNNDNRRHHDNQHRHRHQSGGMKNHEN